MATLFTVYICSYGGTYLLRNNRIFYLKKNIYEYDVDLYIPFQF